MNIVLYTDNFEPITVLDLPVWLLEQLEKVGTVRVAVAKPLSVFGVLPEPASVNDIQDWVVTIYCEKLRWRDGTLKSILVTTNEELALLLRPEWLPGQRATVNNYKMTVRTLTDSLAKALRK